MRLPALLLIPLALAGCSFSRPAVERQSFLVAPERPLAAGRRPERGASLRVGSITVAPPFDGLGMVYRRGDQRYETDFYNEFAVLPADMVGQAAARWLAASGLYGSVFAPGAAAMAGERLEAEVSAWYVDFRAVPPAAVVALRWRLMPEGRAGRPEEGPCEGRASLAERSPAGAARAHGEALGQVLACLERGLAGS